MLHIGMSFPTRVLLTNEFLLIYHVFMISELVILSIYLPARNELFEDETKRDDLEVRHF